MSTPPTDIVDRNLVVEYAPDTCDACGVRAYVYAEMPSGLSLAFCAHHGTAFWDELNRQAAVVIDLRYMVGH